MLHSTVVFFFCSEFSTSHVLWYWAVNRLTSMKEYHLYTCSGCTTSKLYPCVSSMYCFNKYIVILIAEFYGAVSDAVIMI